MRLDRVRRSGPDVRIWGRIRRDSRLQPAVPPECRVWPPRTGRATRPGWPGGADGSGGLARYDGPGRTARSGRLTGTGRPDRADWTARRSGQPDRVDVDGNGAVRIATRRHPGKVRVEDRQA